jgi:BASS family bile acid:Na+ symporter
MQVVMVTIGGPLVVGILVKRFAPEFAARWRGPVGTAAMVTLVVGVLGLVVLAWQGILAAVGNGTLVAIALMTAFGLAVGHFLGGPDADNRNALALATASRHPGVAMGLAAMTDPVSTQAVLGAVLLYLLAGGIFSLPYKRWAKGEAA